MKSNFIAMNEVRLKQAKTGIETLNLKQLAQEQFNIVAKHLLTQGKQSQNDFNDCRYRDKDGLKCAIGCLIPDDEYGLEMEGGVHFLLNNFKISTLDKRLLEFYSTLQALHDLHIPATWKRHLKEFAEELELDCKVLEEF